MSKSNACENGLLQLLFNAVTFANIADNATSSPATILYVSFHTADPGDAGTQSTSECTYTGYARVATNRNSGAWTVTAGSVSPVADITGGACSAGSETITHVGIGLLSTGAGRLLYSGALTPNIGVSAGITPIVTNASTITED